jgi:autotransporter-associated beta strand protein
VAALARGAALGAGVVAATPGHAQSFTWGGAGSTTATADYNLGTNWASPPAGAPPVTSGQSAVFDTTGSTSVGVSPGAVAPDSWTFTANSQSYTISGGAVNFSRAGASGGILDNASAGQTISISNDIGEQVAGVQVQLLGSSTLILSGTNTYGGGTTVSGFGTLQVTNSSSVGSGTVTLQDGQFQAGADNLTFSNNFRINNSPGGSVIDASGHALTISGNIADGVGAGQLTVLNSSFGSGSVILTGTNTYSGGTTICICATLQLGDATHTGSIVGAVINEGRFNIVNANTSGITSITTDGGLTSFFGGNTAGTAVIVNKNVGVTAFFDNSSAGSAGITNRSGGVTLFGSPGGMDTSTAGNATIDNNNGGTIFNAMTNAGSAAITNHNGGGTEFGDSASARFATIVNNSNGSTLFGQAFGTDTATAGNAVITNNFHGETDFNAFTRAGSATIVTNSGGATFFYDNSTGDNAQFITEGSGFVDFSETFGPNGDGHITAGSIAGSGIYYIGGGNTLTVGSNNLSTEVSGVIADFNPCGCGPAGRGTIEKIGTGTLTLSGTNTYTGDTLVDGGTLLVTGSIASSRDVFVDAGATLGGTGTVAATVLSNGATLAPGLPTALGTLTVNDALLFCNCTNYDVKVTSAGSDLTRVVAGSGPGFADLAGTVRVTSLNSSYKFNSPYTILSAQGGFAFFGPTTKFDALVLPAGISGSLSYPPGDVNLTLMSALGQLPGLNNNQHNVANVLDTLFNATGSSGSLGGIFSGNIPQNLSQASGETATGTQQATFDAMNLFLGLLTDPFIDGRGAGDDGGTAPTAFADEDGASAYAASRRNATRDAFAGFPTKADVARNDLLDPHWSVWGAAYGGGSSTDGNAALGSNATTARAFGFAAGGDYRISPDLLAGFALAGGGTNFSVNGLGSGRSDLFQAGAFVRRNVGAAYVSAALGYGWQHVTTDRTVTVAGLDRLHAEFDASAWSGRLEGGYRFATPWMGITPYAAGQFTTFSLPAYAEQALAGSGAFALSYAARDVTAARGEIGVRTDRSFALQNAILTLRGRAAWAHDFNTDRTISAVFQTLPGASFVVNGAAQPHDAALTTLAAETKWLNGFSLAASFEGEFSGISQSYAGKAVARYAW